MTARLGNTVEEALLIPLAPDTAAHRAQAAARWTARFVRRKPLGALAMLWITAVVVIAVAAPVIATHDPSFIDGSVRLHSPSSTFLLGTDELGRDLFSRLVYGTRITLAINGLALVLVVLISVVGGLVAGMARGRVDALLMTANDAFISIPYLMLALAVLAVKPIGLGGSLVTTMLNVALALALGLIPYMVRVVRSAVLSVRELQFIEAARASGSTYGRILSAHVFPNILPVVIVYATTILSYSILAESALAYLGLSVTAPDASWGGLLARQGQTTNLVLAPWIAIFPGLAIALLVFAVNIVGDTLRDLVDPRLRKITE